MRRLFIIRKDLHMSAGKLAAMVGHCAEAYWTRMIRRDSQKITKGCLKPWSAPESPDDKEIACYSSDLIIDKDIFEQYINGAFVKTICEARNLNHLLKAKTMADELSLIEGEDYGFINDKCLTELMPENDDGTTTVGIWFKPLPDEISHQISKKYHLYQ